MAAVTYTLKQLLDEFAVMNRNGDNFIYSDNEVEKALKRAINTDPLVFDIDVDDSVITAADTYSYELERNVQFITEVTWDYSGTGRETPFPYNYKLRKGVLRIDETSVPTGKQLFVYGKIKLSSSDAIPDWLVEYILHNASANAIDLLIADKTGRFLRNDTTMPELQMARTTHKQEAQRLRPMLMNRAALRS